MGTSNEWDSWIERHPRLAVLGFQGSDIVVSTDAPDIALSGGPGTVILKAETTRAGLHLITNGPGLRLEAHVPLPVTSIKFTGDRLSAVAFVLPGESSGLRVDDLSADYVAVHPGVPPTFYGPSLSQTTIDLKSGATLRLQGDAKIGTLVLSGHASIDGQGSLRCATTALQPAAAVLLETDFDTAAELELGNVMGTKQQITMASPKPPKLILMRAHGLTVISPGQVTIWYGGEAVVKSKELEVIGSITGIALGVGKLTVGSGASIWGASGTVGFLDAVNHGEVAGNPESGGVEVLHISRCESAKLLNIAVSSRMSFESLSNLETALQFTPVFRASPRLVSFRRRAQTVGERHLSELHDEAMEHRRTLPDFSRLEDRPESALKLGIEPLYWTRLARLVEQKGASGNSQSVVRLKAADVRRQASPKWRREWWWLSAYRFVGYGERILAPLLLLAVTALAVTWLVSAPSRSGPYSTDGVRLFWETYLAVLIVPLRFFRADVGIGIPDDSIVTSLALAFMQVVGVVLIFFSLTAIRRVTKAD